MSPTLDKDTLNKKNIIDHLGTQSHNLKLGGQPIVGPFPVSVFPQPLQQLIEQTAQHSLYKPDWIGSAILYAVSVAIGNGYGTRFGTHEQKAAIYLAIVGMPGTNKSSPLEYAVKPLRHVDKAAYHLYRQKKKNMING